MYEVAALGMKVDTRDVKSASGDLDRFATSSVKAEKAARGVETASGGVGRATRLASAGVGKLVAALGAVTFGAASFGKFVSVNAEFSASMAKVAAISGATGAEFDALREKAKELGASTQYTAAQAADAIGFLSMAGFSAAESLASIDAVLDMATADSMDLARAADIASNVLSGFGLEAAEAGRLADVLATASAISNTSIEQLGGAMSYAAPAAKALGVSVEQTAAAVGVLSDAGVQGQRAGTGLRAILSKLVAPTNEGVTALKQLGLTVEDVSVQNLGLETVLRNLSDANIDLATATELVGVEAATNLLILAEGADKFAEYTHEVENAEGAAKRMAATMSDNLKGDFMRLNSAVEDLMLALGDTGAAGGLRGLVQGLTGMILAASQFEHLDKVLIGLAGLAAAVAAVAFPVAAAATAIAGAAVLIVAHWDELKAKFPAATQAIETGITGAWAAIQSTATWIGEIFTGLLYSVDSFITSVTALLNGDWSLAWTSANDAVWHLALAFGKVFQPFHDLLASMIEAVWQFGLDLKNKFVETLGDLKTAMVAKFNEAWAGVKEAISGWVADMVEVGRNLVAGLVQGIRDAPGNIKAAVEERVGNAITWAKDKLGIQSPSKVFKEIGEQTIEGYIDGLESMDPALQKTVEGMTDKVSEKFDDMNDEIASRAQALGSNVAQFLTGQVDMPTFWDSFKQMALDSWTGILEQAFAPGGGGISAITGGLQAAFQGISAGLAAGTLGGLMSAVSAAMPIIGAVIGLVQLIQGFHTSQVVGAGVKGTLGKKVNIDNWKKIEHSWFWGLFSSTENQTKDAPGLTRYMQRQTDDVRRVMTDLADIIGASADGIDKVKHKFKFDTKGWIPSEVREELGVQLEAYTDKVAKRILGGRRRFLMDGESWLDALQRMASDFPVVQSSLRLLGQELFTVSRNGADAASRLAQLFGGADGFSSAMDSYFSAFYSGTEQLSNLRSFLTYTLSELGLAMPTTREGFRALVEAQDLMTESGRETYATLVGLSGQFDILLPKIADGVQSLYQDIGDLISAAQQAANEFGGLADQLEATARAVRITGLSSANAYAATRTRFEALSALALAGDADAMGQITTVATELARLATGQATTAAEYQYITSTIAARLDRIAGVARAEEEMSRFEAENLLLLQEAMQNSALTNELLVDTIAAVDGIGDDIVSGLRELFVATTGQIPAFARGGFHSGGLRLVGEQGPEIEATGPARYMSTEQTRRMLGQDALAEEMRKLREEQRQLAIKIERHTRRTYDLLNTWNVVGMPPEATA